MAAAAAAETATRSGPNKGGGRPACASLSGSSREPAGALTISPPPISHGALLLHNARSTWYTTAYERTRKSSKIK